MSRFSDGRFCTQPNGQGGTCNALMEEKSVFWRCPKGHDIVFMESEEIEEKLAREQVRSEHGGKIAIRSALSMDGKELFARPNTRGGAK